MRNAQNDPRDRDDRDKMSLADLVGEVPWPETWCAESLIDRIAQTQNPQRRS
jgi:hypothetical protein